MSSRLWHAFAVLTFVASGLISEARADNIAYAYDALGRLIQATDNTTQQAIIYGYDSVGNIVSQQTVPLTTLAISGFSTNQGAPGSQITIDGTGFSSTPSANTVMINGVAATVVSATQTQLVVDLPSTATSGPFTVTIGSTTVTSSNSLTVGTGGALPTITSFSPTIGGPGTVVTVSGSGFQSTASGNSVEFNQSWAQVSAATATTLTTSVPAEGTSGPITVATPFGQVVSGTSFVVPPSGYSSSNIGSSGNLTIGSPAAIAISANLAALRLFNGTRGQLLAIGVSGDTIASCIIKVFDPAGNLLVTSAAITASGQGVQIPALPRDGTYTIVVDAGGNAGTLTLDVVGPVQGTLTQGGAAQPIALSVPGQAAQLTFSGTQGAFVSLTLSAVTLSAGTVNILDPSGSVLISGSLGTAGLALQPQLPMSGTYTVQVIPNGSVAGSLSAALATASAASLAVNSTYSLPITGQTVASVSFQGATAQYLSLVISENGGTIPGATITVVAPNGAPLTTVPFAASSCLGCGYTGSALVNMGPLPSSGTYTVQVQQTGTSSGTLSLTLSVPVTATLTANNPSNVTTSLLGQPMQLTFSGSPGQYLALAISESQSQIAGASITVLAPSGTRIASGGLSMSVCNTCTSQTGDGLWNLGPLPSSGTYTVLVQQISPGTGQLTFTLSAPVTGALSVSGSTNVTATQSGQPMQLTFAGTAGQYLGLVISETSGRIAGVTITVLAPDGTQLTNVSSGSWLCQGTVCNGDSGSVLVNLGPLPSTGTYTVLVQQNFLPLPGTGQLTFTLSAAVTGALSVGGSTNVTTTQSGQPMQLTFPGAAGQYLALVISETSGAIAQANITVLATNGTQLTSVGFVASRSAQGDSAIVLANLGPLPSTGTYTVLVQQPLLSGTGQLAFTLSTPVTGSLSVGGSTSATVSLLGQGWLYGFSGTAGQILKLTVSESGSGIAAVSIAILNPDGSTLTTGQMQAPSSPFGGHTGSTTITTPSLPATGNYTLLVQQGASVNLGTGTLTFSLSQ